MFGLLMTIIVGFIVGVIAKLIMPGKENMGFVITTLLGIAGSLVATYAGQAVGWYEAGQGAGWIGSIVGAFVLLWIYEKFQSRRAAALLLFASFASVPLVHWEPRRKSDRLS
jgi:uncharacterized membrane protein YeaQ/YmgE (transglycosylase-associated protein family)